MTRGMWGNQEGPRPHVFKAGDELRPWKTYSQLWNEHRYTRGALDKLMLAGQVPFTDGESLVAFLLWGPGLEGKAVRESAARLGADLVPLPSFLELEAARLGVELKQAYYDMQQFIAMSAVDMLVLPPAEVTEEYAEAVSPEEAARVTKLLADLREREARLLGGTALVTAFWTCHRCGAEVTAAPTREGCGVCVMLPIEAVMELQRKPR